MYGGLIFEEASPRNVSRETAQNIIAHEPDLLYVDEAPGDGLVDGGALGGYVDAAAFGESRKRNADLHDVVSLSNLQRQVIHGMDDIGGPKTVSAAETTSSSKSRMRPTPAPAR